MQGGSSSASGPLASHPLPKRVFLVLRKWSAACHSPLAPNSPLEMLLNLNPNAEIPTYAPIAPSTPSLNTDIVISWLHTHHVIQFSPKVFIEYLPVPGTATINSFMLKGTYILRGETNMERGYYRAGDKYNYRSTSHVWRKEQLVLGSGGTSQRR